MAARIARPGRRFFAACRALPSRIGTTSARGSDGGGAGGSAGGASGGSAGRPGGSSGGATTGGASGGLSMMRVPAGRAARAASRTRPRSAGAGAGTATDMAKAPPMADASAAVRWQRRQVSRCSRKVACSAESRANSA
jgi:hypothetical protein